MPTTPKIGPGVRILARLEGLSGLQENDADVVSEDEFASYLLKYSNIVTVANDNALPQTGEDKKLYVSLSSGNMYAWNNGSFLHLNEDATTTEKLKTARTLSATGDATWNVSFDGSANVTSALTLSNTGVAAGTYSKLTVDSKGRVTAGTSLSSSDVTTALGFTPYNSTNPNSYQTLTQVNAAIQAVVGAAPEALNTLQEIAAAIQTDSSTISALTTTVGNKADKTYVDTQLSAKANTASLSAVATSGNYSDLSGTPRLENVAITGSFNDLLNKPTTLSGYGITDALSSSGGTISGSLSISGAASIAGAATAESLVVTNSISANSITTSTDGVTISASTAIPTNPVAGSVKSFGRKLANREMLGTVDSNGLDVVLQPAAWRQKIAFWNPPGNATTVPGVVGFSAPTAVGTATARTVATTNLFTRTLRLGYRSATSTGSLCGHYSTAAQFTTGTGSGIGGFFYSCRFGFSDASNLAAGRGFVGLTSSVAAPTNVEPSTILNCVGIAQLSSNNTQLYIVYGGSAAQTAIPLGTDFPPMAGSGATNGIAYDLTLYSPPTANGVIHYRVERIGTTYIAEGTITPTVVGTQTPASTTLLAHRAWRTNNSTGAEAGIDVIGIYIETDY